MSSAVGLYVGKGADPFCAKALENQLQKWLDKEIHEIIRIQSFYDCIDEPDLFNTLFVPGGNAVQMSKGLDKGHLDGN